MLYRIIVKGLGCWEKIKIPNLNPLTILLILPLFLNCPKRIGVKTVKIEALYLSSIYEDILRKEPILAGIGESKGTKIGYLSLEPAYMSILLERLGFYQLLNELPIDFIITDSPIYGMKYFSIPKSLGYGIKNYQGIRFAIFSKDKDSLTIADETKLMLVKERSDVLWIIDKKLLNLPPMKIDFFIRNRELSDTNMLPIKLKCDSLLLQKITKFRNVLYTTINKKISLENKKLDEYILAKLLQKEGANVILYPSSIFRKTIASDSISVSEILTNVACEAKFKKVELTKDEIQKIVKDKGYLIWGNITKKNIVLLPDNEGRYLYDIIFS